MEDDSERTLTVNTDIRAKGKEIGDEDDDGSESDDGNRESKSTQQTESNF